MDHNECPGCQREIPEANFDQFKEGGAGERSAWCVECGVCWYFTKEREVLGIQNHLAIHRGMLIVWEGEEVEE